MGTAETVALFTVMSGPTTTSNKSILKVPNLGNVPTNTAGRIPVEVSVMVFDGIDISFNLKMSRVP